MPKFSGRWLTAAVFTAAEFDICSAAAMSADRAYDPHAVTIPWSGWRRNLTASGGDTGHYLVGTGQEAVADALRPWSVAVSAGLTVVPNLRSNEGFPRIDADLTGAWLQDENTAIVPSQPTVGQIAVSQNLGRGNSIHASVLAARSGRRSVRPATAAARCGPRVRQGDSRRLGRQRRANGLDQRARRHHLRHFA